MRGNCGDGKIAVVRAKIKRPRGFPRGLFEIRKITSRTGLPLFPQQQATTQSLLGRGDDANTASAFR
jgi:hypothetical protein